MTAAESDLRAGIFQPELLGMNLRALRMDGAALRRGQSQQNLYLDALTGDVSRLCGDALSLKRDAADLRFAQNRQAEALTADIAELKADIADLKAAVQEILRHLVPPAT